MSDVENYILLIFKKLNLDNEPFPLIIVVSNTNKKKSPNMFPRAKLRLFLKNENTNAIFLTKEPC